MAKKKPMGLSVDASERSQNDWAPYIVEKHCVARKTLTVYNDNHEPIGVQTNLHWCLHDVDGNIVGTYVENFYNNEKIDSTDTDLMGLA